MKYKVKLSYPTIIVVNGQETQIFPQTEVELPDAEIIQTYVSLGYIEPIQDTGNKKKKEVNENAS